MSHPFPPSLVSAEAKLADVFPEEAAHLGVGLTDVDRLFRILPASVKSASAVKFTLGPDWRYVFGTPFHLRGRSRAIGTPQAPFVASLVRATLVAEQFLTSKQLRQYWWRLDQPTKHLDAIVEMLTVWNISADSNLSYEQLGLGVSSHSIDWLLKTKVEGDFLLEVKNRPGQMAQELMRNQKDMEAGAQSITGEPVTNFEALFKSVSSKFLPISDSTCIQGAALFLGIKVPALLLNEFFHDHLQNYLHFVALSKEDKQAGALVNLLAISPEIANQVLSAFGWHEGADLTY